MINKLRAWLSSLLDKKSPIGFDAVDQAADYFQNDFQCRNADCIEKNGRMLWAGSSFRKENLVPGKPWTLSSAVLVEFECTIGF